MGRFDLFSFILASFGSFWVSLGLRLGPFDLFWVALARFGLFWFVLGCCIV